MENSAYSVLEDCAVDGGGSDTRRYLATVAVEIAFFFRLEAESREQAVEEALAKAKAAQYKLTGGGEAISIEIRGCDAIAL